MQQAKVINWDDVKARVAAAEASLVGRPPTAEQLERVFQERATKLAARPVVDLTPLVTVMTFSFGDQRFGLELTSLGHVVAYRGALAVPGAAPEVLGLVSFLGEIYPVVDVARLVKQESPPPDVGYVLMLRRRRERLGLRIRAIEGVERTKLFQPDSDSPYGSLVRAVGNDSLLLLDAAEILKKFV